MKKKKNRSVLKKNKKKIKVPLFIGAVQAPLCERPISVEKLVIEDGRGITKIDCAREHKTPYLQPV